MGGTGDPTIRCLVRGLVTMKFAALHEQPRSRGGEGSLPRRP
jgi:hypothetical protein